MNRTQVQHGDRVVALVGSGLARAVGLAAHHDRTNSFEGVPVPQLASKTGWATMPDLVRRYYDTRRIDTAPVLPSEAHEALARAQHALTRTRCRLVSENIDGMLQKASAEQVLDLHGSLFRLRCANDPSHPRLGVYGTQNVGMRCSVCGSVLRPDVVWSDEPVLHQSDIDAAVTTCDVFLAVGTSVSSPAVIRLIGKAKASGARTVEINPIPTGLGFDEVHAQPAQDVLPQLVSQWLD